MTQIVSRRITKYTDSILSILCQLQHATNAEIASRLRELYSNVSDTTVHRITQRLRDDGVIGLAPASRQGWFAGTTFHRNHTIILYAASAIVYRILKFLIQCVARSSASLMAAVSMVL